MKVDQDTFGYTPFRPLSASLQVLTLDITPLQVYTPLISLPAGTHPYICLLFDPPPLYLATNWAFLKHVAHLLLFVAG